MGGRFENTDKSFIQLLQEQDEETSRFSQIEKNEETFDISQFKEDDSDSTALESLEKSFENTEKSFIQLLQEQDKKFSISQFNRDDSNGSHSNSTAKPIQLNPGEVGDVAGELVTQIINNLVNNVNGTIDIVTALVEGVSGAIETAVGPTNWNYLCVATWWPLDEEHCNQARCAMCSPSIAAAMKICQSTTRTTDHRCVQ